MMKRWACLLFVLLLPVVGSAQNFVVRHNDSRMALQLATAAERIRDDLATKWFGRPFPDWDRPCVLTYTPARGTGGVTSYSFRDGRLSSMEMHVEGTPTDVFKDTLPHEVMHLVLAHRFGYPLPRWIDEGLCSNVESVDYITKLDARNANYLNTQRGIPTNILMMMRDYPADVEAFYAQSSSVTRFLLWRGGVETVEDVLSKRQIGPTQLAQAFRFRDVADLQTRWLDWVKDGSPRIQRVLQPNMQFGCPTCPPSQTMPQAVPFIPNRGNSSAPPQQSNSNNDIPSTPYADQAVPRVDAPPTTLNTPSGGKCECDGLTMKQGDDRWLTREEAEGMVSDMIEAGNKRWATKDELAAVQAKPGPPGRDGKDGRDGDPGAPGERGPAGQSPAVDDIVAQVMDRLDGSIRPTTGNPQPGIPAGGNDCGNDSGNDSGGVEPSRLPRVLYFTSRGCVGCREANAIAERLKRNGLPVTIITLAERDAAVEGVPRVFVPDTERTVLGASNVATFLSTFFP